MSDDFEADHKVETYARTLIEASRSENGSDADLSQHHHARNLSLGVLETLSTMLEAGDFDLTDSVAKKYKDILDSHDETVSVVVTTAVPMDDSLRRKARVKVEGDLQRPVYLIEKVDPSILGGIILEVHGKRFDASVRAQLADIRKTLISTYVGSDR